MVGWVFAPAAQAAEPGHDMGRMWRASLARPPLAATAAFGPDGGLWLASVRDGHVWVSRSGDRGRSFGPAVKVNPEPEAVAADGENRPKVLATRDGKVYVSYTQSLEQPFSGHVRFSRSLDGGRSFSAPVTVNRNQEAISHRFDALGVNDRGQVFIAWLDKRDGSAAARAGEKYAGAALYYAVSDDQGASFRPDAKAADHSCECCRVAMAMDPEGVPVVLWRQIYGRNVRDHAALRLDGSPPKRASLDGWEMDACPHHGPAISIAADGVWHLAWFTNAARRQGLFYARSADRGESFGAAVGFGGADAQAAHPDVLSLGREVFLAWKEFDGREAAVRLMASADGGQTWSAPRTVAATAGASDHPRLLADRGTPYLAWNTAKEGFRLIPLGAE